MTQLFFRNSKFSSATIQGDNDLRKYPHNGLVNIYQSEKTADGRLFYDATFQILGPGNESTLPPEFVVGEGFAVNIVAGFWVPMHIIGKLEIEQNKLHFRNIDNEWLQGALKSRLITVPSAHYVPYFLSLEGVYVPASKRTIHVGKIAMDNYTDNLIENSRRSLWSY